VVSVDVPGEGETGSAEWESLAEAYREYLEAVATRLRDEGLEVTTELVPGDAGPEILRYADRQGCDLIVMATHARSGLGRWVHGSVAEQILAATPVPILMVRAVEEN
jgi:nucleotide-binding universal stress UspA family protein